jgi:hypothetical protein
MSLPDSVNVGPSVRLSLRHIPKTPDRRRLERAEYDGFHAPLACKVK